MSSEARFDLYGQATIWADQLRTDPSFTFADSEELKGHLLDIAEELVSQGLSEAEAFAAAVSRLGGPAELREEFEETNAPVIQLRKTILVLSGILFFLLFFFFVTTTARLLVLALGHFNPDEVQNGIIVKAYSAFYLILIGVFAIIHYFTELRLLRNFDETRIKPIHTFLLFSGILILAVTNKWLDGKISQTFDHISYTFYYQYTIFDYFNYLFPLVTIICFIVLYKKYNRTNISFDQKLPVKSFLIVFSGILIYYFLRFLLHSSARIFLSALQFHLNDPELNIRRTWSYIMTFQFFFVFLTAALYFLDKNLIKRLRKIHIKPSHTVWLLFATIFLAILDRCFFPIAINLLGHPHGELFHRYWQIFIVSELSFPFVLGACFLVLFSKYYRDCLHIGNN